MIHASKKPDRSRPVSFSQWAKICSRVTDVPSCWVSHERAIRSLQSWVVYVNEAFVLGGVEKVRVLEVLRPLIFFDDQTTHLDEAVGSIAGVHIPYGVANADDVPAGQ